jgi:hypothetical protein
VSYDEEQLQRMFDVLAHLDRDQKVLSQLERTLAPP